MAKQVPLALFTKRKTGSKPLVGVLSKLGYSLSYPELNAVETDVVNKQLKNRNIHSDVPPSLIPQTRTTYVYDNCDHNSKSQFVANMHCTNGIAIQERVSFEQPATIESEAAAQAKIRQSFYTILMEIEPCLTPSPCNELNEIFSLSIMEGVLWSLGRYISGESNMRVLPG